jgi:hypothetical protein
MEPINPADPAYVTELQVVCRAEHVAEVAPQLPVPVEVLEKGPPGCCILLGIVSEGILTPEAQQVLRELGRQGLLLQYGLHKHCAGVKFVTFEEMRSGKYAGQLVAVRPWDMPHPDQLPPGVTVKRSSFHFHAEGRPPQEGE